MYEIVEKLRSLPTNNLLQQLAVSDFHWLFSLTFFLIGAGLMIGWVALTGIVWIYLERRVAAFIQGRLGPNRVGPYGFFQSFADGIKLLAKEDVIPQIASRALFIMAPILVFVGGFLPFAVLPFSERLYVSNMELGLFYILSFEALEVIGILMAGWGPGSKWSLYGGMRLAAQMLSYEVPLSICVLVVVLLTGSLNLQQIVLSQSENWIFGWLIFQSPAAALACLLFFVGGFASTKRAPFDLPEAESELVAGFHTEYSGLRFAMFFLAEYGSMFVICALTTLLFLGGWHAPLPLPEAPQGVSIIGRYVELIGANAILASFLAIFSDSSIWQILFRELVALINFLSKTFFLYFVMLWVRWTLPRIRIDQVMYICLKVLLPFSLVAALWALFQVSI